jgi:hypothetical protein
MYAVMIEAIQMVAISTLSTGRKNVKEHNDNDDDINEIQKQLKTLLCV